MEEAGESRQDVHLGSNSKLITEAIKTGSAIQCQLHTLVYMEKWIEEDVEGELEGRMNQKKWLHHCVWLKDESSLA